MHTSPASIQLTASLTCSLAFSAPIIEGKPTAVIGYFSTLVGPRVTGLDYVIICDDPSVQWEQDTYNNPPDPRGIWVDHRLRWAAKVDDFNP